MSYRLPCPLCLCPACLSLSLPLLVPRVRWGQALLCSGQQGVAPGAVWCWGVHLQVWAEWPLFASALHNAAVVQSLVALGGWSGAPKHPRAPLGTIQVGIVRRAGVQLWWQAEKCGGTQGCDGWVVAVTAVTSSE